MARKAKAHEVGDDRPDAGRATHGETDAAQEPAPAAGDDAPGQDGEPLRTVSDALQRASEALGMDGRDSGSGDPGAYGVLGRVVYRASYGLSYGLVYPVALLAGVIPKENALVHGLVDGALAARDAVYGTGNDASESSRAAEAPAPEPQPA